MRKDHQKMMALTTQMDKHEDQMDLISLIYPGLCTQTQIAAPQEESKPRRWRKKHKGREENNQHGEAKKRKLTQEQTDLLELNFRNEHKLVSERKYRIAAEVGLDPRQVSVWFQNRRARWKNKNIEEDYNKLKSLHETAVLDKRRLETEVVKLKEQLYEAEKGIRQLTERIDSVSCTNTSSISMEANIDPVFQGKFGFDDAFYVGEDSFVLGME